MSPLDIDPPRCPKCSGMMTGDTRRLECIPPPAHILPVEPEEWCNGCHTVLRWDGRAWVPNFEVWLLEEAGDRFVARFSLHNRALMEVEWYEQRGYRAEIRFLK